MTLLGHDRYCAEVLDQTRDLTDLLAAADPATPVPTCPGWTVTDLRRHLGGNLLTVATAVRTGIPATAPDGEVPDMPGALPAWLSGAAAEFARTLRAAGPARVAEVWGIAQSTGEWARRAAQDLVVHRADAAAAVGTAFTVAPDLGTDTVDELFDLAPDIGSGERLAAAPARTGTLRLTATGTADSASGASPGGPGAAPSRTSPDAARGRAETTWVVEVTGEGDAGFRLRHAGPDGGGPGREGDADVTVRGALPDVLRVMHRRLPPSDRRVEVTGDADLLDFWLDRVRIG